MTDNESNSLGGRIRRYARVTGAVGGLAARVAGQRYLGLGPGAGGHAGELTAALGGLKGPLMKVAQILATIPDALPESYVEQLAALQSDAPPMGWLFVRRRMAGELGAAWQQRFRGFEHEAAAAASLGQVHRAWLEDGRAVACKLQYPDMASAVEADLRQLSLIFSIYRRYDSSIDTAEIHQELSARLREELDYRREARHIRLYRLMLADAADVHLPEPVEALSTGRLLTMSWLDGERLLDVLARDPDQEARNRIAEALFRAWYLPFYRYGVIHGDPHLGNYAVRADGGINLLDFGCVRVFRPDFVKGVIDLYKALRDDDEELAVAAYRAWGFESIDRATIEVLNLWARFLYGPLMDDRVRRLQETPSGSYGRKVLAQVHAELRTRQGVRPPRPFLLMDRAAIGLGSVFLRLGAELNWHRAFHELIDGFDMNDLATRQSAALAEAGVPVAA